MPKEHRTGAIPPDLIRRKKVRPELDTPTPRAIQEAEEILRETILTAQNIKETS